MAFWVGFSSGPKRAAKRETQDTPGDLSTAAPQILGRYAGGYSDPALKALSAPGRGGLPPPEVPDPGPPGAVPKPAEDPAQAKALAETAAAEAASPFFGSAASPGAGFAAPSTDVSKDPSSQGATPQGGAGTGFGPIASRPDDRQGLKDARAEDYLTSPLRAPLSPWEVKAGTVISAALLTGINSDLPGEIIAQVTEPVYDHVTGRWVLIPQGSRLIGTYSAQIVYGQARTLIAWTRLIMPDGHSINLGAMGGGDLAGASGLKDKIDAHGWQLLKGVALSTVFSVGAASAQDASARSSGGLVINSAGAGVATEAQGVGQQLTARDLNRQPTLTVRAGWPLKVLVNKDMILQPYASPSRTEERPG